MNAIRYWLLPGVAGRPGVVLTTVCCPAVANLAISRDGNGGAANKAVVRDRGQKVPHGATHYRDDWRRPWQPIDQERLHGEPV